MLTAPSGTGRIVAPKVGERAGIHDVGVPGNDRLTAPETKGAVGAAEPAPSLPWRRGRFWLAFASYWLAFGLLFTGTHFVRGQRHPSGEGLSIVRSAAVAFSDTVFLALLCLGAFALAWHLPLDGEPRRRNRNLAVAALAAPVGAMGVQWMMTTVASAIAGVPVPPLHILLLLASPTQLLLFTCFLGSGYAIRYFLRVRESSLRQAHLEADRSRLESQLTGAELQLTRAELKVLKMQLDPHFLFNTLNSISMLMYKDVTAADEMLTRLSHLLRLTLSRSGDQEVTLREELEFLRIYLQIQQTRFGDRLVVDWEIEAGMERACVPHLILQPVVENAIHHGVSTVRGVGRIRITARRVADDLVLRVQDSGPGFAADWEPRLGAVGLANTHARLEQMYGERQTLDLRNSPQGGAMVTLTLPFRTGTRPPRAQAPAPEPVSCVS